MRAEALLPYSRALPRAAVARPAQTFTLLLLIGLLPFFVQSFQYLSDVPLLWTLAKVSPILLAPLTLLGLLRLRLPYVPLTLAVLAYVMLVAPVMSMLQLQNNLTEGLASTVKVWAFTFYFAASFFLVAMRVSEATLTRALLTLGLLTYAVLWLLWVILPLDFYAREGAGNSIFLADQERGPRIVLPLAFGLIGMFWLARRFGQRPALWPMLLMLTGWALMFTIYKQRTVIAAMTVIILWGMTLGLRRRAPALFWGLAVGGATLAAALLPILLPLLGNPVRDSLGGSLSVRQNSGEVLLAYLYENPLRWIFGVGGSTEFSQINIQVILRTPDFFFADLGWLGVAGEYGLVGAGIIALFCLAALNETRRAARAAPTPMRQALRDFMVYLLLTSPILSVVFTPGQIATVLAIAVYLNSLAPPAAAASRPASLVAMRRPQLR